MLDFVNGECYIFFTVLQFNYDIIWYSVLCLKWATEHWKGYSDM